MTDALVIIPTYNEKENIEAIIRAVFNQEKEFHILVVDDNSPDGTASIVNKLMTEFKGKLFIENRTNKNGLGKAYLCGFDWALQKDYDYIIQMDADFSHNPNDLKFIEVLIKKNDTLWRFERYKANGHLFCFWHSKTKDSHK